MTITKLGHSCLVVQEKELKLIIDPGSYTVDAMKNITGLDVILVTDEHQDHFDVGAIETLRANNSGVKIFTQKAVQKLLADKNIPSETILNKEVKTVKSVTIEGCGEKHALLHSSVPQSDNTGYIIAGRLFHPGDAFTIPEKQIEILALPVAGPWLKISEAIDYAIAVHPKVCFPIHDGRGSFIMPFEKILPEHGIQFVKPEGEMTF